MSSEHIVIGSSGFLGRQVVALLKDRPLLLTHCHTPEFTGSLKYDFFNDDLPITKGADPGIIFFTASIEMEHPTSIISDRFSRLLDQVTDHRFVYLSSDGIFSGQQGRYTESSEPDPVTRYGRNLFACETLIKERCANFCIIRPSYIYGYVDGVLDSRLSRTRDALRNDRPVALFDDMFKSPLGVHQVSEAVVQLGLSDFVGTMHVAGERMSVYEFHRQAMEAMGVDTLKLSRDKMPHKPGFLKDTSLVSDKWQSMMGGRPLSVTETLQDHESR